MSDLRKLAKGTISELTATLHYVNLGWSVYYPYDHDTEIDLILTKGPRVKRVQVKTVYECGEILRVNIDHKKEAKYSPDSVDTMVCVYKSKLWVIPMEDIEEETTLNFGKIDGGLSNTRGSFSHSKYLIGE